jgi:hypothetical protein
MCKAGIADIAMDGEGRDKIEITGFQVIDSRWKFDTGSPVHDIENAGKRTAHVFPVPVTVMMGQSNMKGVQMKPFY